MHYEVIILIYYTEQHSAETMIYCYFILLMYVWPKGISPGATRDFPLRTNRLSTLSSDPGK